MNSNYYKKMMNVSLVECVALAILAGLAIVIGIIGLIMNDVYGLALVIFGIGMAIVTHGHYDDFVDYANSYFEKHHEEMNN